ncbi:MAG: glycoside hydrolase family 127 protein [Clostridia bacterium]|nr:glycoside hydrolase family 127 protein [Clostridia bacterium]
MPLKPIFDKAPLTAMTCQALRPGMVRSEHPKLKQIAALLAGDAAPQALEPAFRLTCLTQAEPDQSAAAAQIRRALAAQKEDGSFDMPLCDAVAVLRACWALYEYEARKPLLEHIARWCSWAAQHWDMVQADDELWANPADLLELLEQLYRVTGKSALLTMISHLSQQAMNWSAVLNTINVQRPTSRSTTREELEAGLRAEQGSREGYHTHFVRTNSPEMLADGARACIARGWVSGSATEMNAARTGWERLQRHHGAICGGLTSDELLEGATPCAAVSAAAVGAWAEALCSAAAQRQGDWAFEPVERIALNAMPDSIGEDGVRPFQRVNALVAEPGTDDCFRVTDDHAQRALYRMARGCAAVASAAVMARPDGFAVNMYIPGRYQVPVGDGVMMLTLRMESGACSIQVNCRQPVRAAARLRLPSWARSTDITINGMESDAGKDATAACMTIERIWHDGDVLAVTLEESLRVEEGHHQGRYVLRGAKLMCMPAGKDWACSFVSCMEVEAGVVALVDRVPSWKARGDVPADIPVLPAPTGEELTRVRLVPYAEAGARIALFPGRSKA